MQGGSKYILPNAKEPIEVQVFDVNAQPLRGKTDISLYIRRNHDDLYLDWHDDTFKLPTEVIQMFATLQEVSSLYAPGIYRLNTVAHVCGLDTSRITNATNHDVYAITVVQIGGTDAVGLPTGFELHVDATLVDRVDNVPNAVNTALSTFHGIGSWQAVSVGNIADAVWNSMQNDHVIAGSFGDLMRRIVALQKENYFIDQMTYNSRGLMIAGRIRLFDSKTGAMSATDGGINEGEFATYSFNTTSTTGTTERARTARSVRDT